MGDALVVGGGVAGMSAALHLRRRGHRVLLLEASDRLGGKLGEYRRDGFRWDTGPSLLTLPDVLDEVLRLGGLSLADTVTLERLDPVCRYRFADGTDFDARATEADSAAEVERLRPGNAADWHRWHARARRSWEVSRRTFLAGPMAATPALARRMSSPRDLVAIDPLPTLAGRAARTFTDPRLRQWAGRYATYSGSSPFRAPATLACISAVEQDGGGWAVRGGLTRLAEALEQAVRGAGVTVRTGAPVTRLLTAGGAVTGAVTADGEQHLAGATVVTVDAERLYADLLPRRRALGRVRAAGRSSSGFTVLLGLRGRTPGLAHHTVLFPADTRAEFASIHDRGEAPADPTIYLCRPGASDPEGAPPGDESVMLLVNVPGDGRIDWARTSSAYAAHLLDVLARRGVEVRDRVAVLETIDPSDLEARHGARGGAIYGTSSNGRRAAFLRPSNRGAVPGLFLAGGSSHPGGGLPLVALSGGFAADLATSSLGGAG